MDILKKYENNKWKNGTIIWKAIVSVSIPILVSFAINIIAKQFEIKTFEGMIAKIATYILITFPIIIYSVKYIYAITHSIYLDISDSLERQIEIKIIKKIIGNRMNIEL